MDTTDDFREKARLCRRLAGSYLVPEDMQQALLLLADEFDARAAAHARLVLLRDDSPRVIALPGKTQTSEA